MQKKPTQPQGSGPLEVWIRTLLLPYIYSLELTSVVGLRKIANPSGGYALVKDNDARGPAVEFPFQVYRSDPDLLRFMLTPGYIVTTGEPFEPTNIGTYVALGENVTGWIYLDITSTEATIVATTTLPTWSVNKILVAKVVTTTFAAAPTITQILRENPQVPCA